MIINWDSTITRSYQAEMDEAAMIALLDEHKIPAGTGTLSDRIEDAESGQFWDALMKLAEVTDEDITEGDIYVQMDEDEE